MATLTGLTYGQLAWEPRFIQDIEQSTCLGCGRCFKVCGRNVMTLRGINEDGEFLDDDDDDDIERKVMVVVHPEYCIGCEACSRICPKNCHSHASLAIQQ